MLKLLIIIICLAIALPLVWIALFARSIPRGVQNPVAIWNHLERVPIMRWFKSPIFIFVLGRVNPYCRSIDLHITELKHGYVSAVLRDRKSIRSPFKCVHAGALAMFGETIGALTIFSAIKPKDRAILTRLDAKYMRKAQGPITGSASFKRPAELEAGRNDIDIEITLKDFILETVAIIKLTWALEDTTL